MGLFQKFKHLHFNHNLAKYPATSQLREVIRVFNMGLQLQPEVWQPISTDFLVLRSLTRQTEPLRVTKTTLSNQLEAVTSDGS